MKIKDSKDTLKKDTVFHLMIAIIKHLATYISGNVRCSVCGCRLPELPPSFANGMCLECFKRDLGEL